MIQCPLGDVARQGVVGAEIQRSIENLGAEKIGPFCVDSTAYFPESKLGRFTETDQPWSVSAVEAAHALLAATDG